MGEGIRLSGKSREIRSLLGGLLFFLFVASATIFAQLPTATVLGVVKDSSGAVVPEVKLTVRNVDTGQTRDAVTDPDGAYRVPALPVGNYEVRAEKEGFNTQVQSGLTLAVSQEAVVNITLQVGSVGQTVSVTAEAPLVNTTSGSLGGLVSEERMADLPLNGRNYVDLTLMQMGVSEQKSVITTGSASGISGTYFSSNGAPVRSNNYLLDGAILTNLWGASSASISGSTLGVEGIREYRIITNSFSAEYGMTMGSQMIIVSKGGTNRFHGDVFEYLRNSALDAANFFDKPVQANGFKRLPEFRRNNFGGSFGGPIRKDKTFFFGVFEGVREQRGVTIIDNVPPAICHQATNIVDNQACLGASTAGTTAVAAVIQPILALYPAPDLPGNQYTFPYIQPTNDDYGQMRIDHNFSSADSLFGRYTIQNTTQKWTEIFPQFQTLPYSRGQFLTLSENHIFSPSLLNTFRASLSRTTLTFADVPGEPSGPQYSLIPGKPIGLININNLSTIGSNGSAPFLRKQNIFSYSDDIYYTSGRHSFKFGALVNHYQQEISSGSSAKGTVTFTSLSSFLIASASQIRAFGVPPASLLIRTFHYNTLGFYAQDDVRVRSNLTFNLGFRYEFNTVPQEEHGQWSALENRLQDTNVTITSSLYKNPSMKNFSPRVGFAWDVKGDGKTAVRGGFGLLYDVGQAGFLIIQGLSGNLPYTSTSTVSNPAVFTIPLTFPTGAASRTPRLVDWNMRQPHILQYNLTVERQLPWSTALTVAYAGSRGLNLPQYTEGNPTIPQGIPGLVGGLPGCVARPAGQLPLNIAQMSEVDGPTANACWLGGDTRTNPSWGTMDLFDAAANSWYSGLEVGVIKRFTKGLQFQSSYTWSKLIDTLTAYSGVENSSGSTSIQSNYQTDANHPNVDKGVSPYDLTQVWKFNAIYNFPSPFSSDKIASKFLNGWWMSGILTLQSGLPFSPALSANRSLSGSGGGPAALDRPDLVAGRSIASMTSGTTAALCGGTGPTRANGGTAIPAGTPLGGPSLYFDPCAFTTPTAGFLGNAGRNILRGPAFKNLDFSLVKDTPVRKLGEGGKVEFRAEFFNILNHPNFALPGRIVFAGKAIGELPGNTAGQITSTSATSRQIQLALKILF